MKAILIVALVSFAGSCKHTRSKESSETLSATPSPGMDIPNIPNLRPALFSCGDADRNVALKYHDVAHAPGLLAKVTLYSWGMPTDLRFVSTAPTVREFDSEANIQTLKLFSGRIEGEYPEIVASLDRSALTVSLDSGSLYRQCVRIFFDSEGEYEGCKQGQELDRKWAQDILAGKSMKCVKGDSDTFIKDLKILWRYSL